MASCRCLQYAGRHGRAGLPAARSHARGCIAAPGPVVRGHVGPVPVPGARTSKRVPRAWMLCRGGHGRNVPAAAFRHGAACGPSWPWLCHGESMQRPSMNVSSHGRGTRTTDLNLRVACIRPSAHAASGRGQQAGGRAPADAYTVPTGCTHRACNETPTILQSSYSQHTVSITVSVKDAWFSDSQH